MAAQAQPIKRTSACKRDLDKRGRRVLFCLINMVRIIIVLKVYENARPTFY
jgi:hypothetical protein